VFTGHIVGEWVEVAVLSVWAGIVAFSVVESGTRNAFETVTEILLVADFTVFITKLTFSNISYFISVYWTFILETLHHMHISGKFEPIMTLITLVLTSTPAFSTILMTFHTFVSEIVGVHGRWADLNALLVP